MGKVSTSAFRTTLSHCGQSGQDAVYRQLASNKVSLVLVLFATSMQSIASNYMVVRWNQNNFLQTGFFYIVHPQHSHVIYSHTNKW